MSEPSREQRAPRLRGVEGGSARREAAGVRSDAVGAILLSTWLAWVVAASVWSGGEPRRMLLLVSGCALALCASRIVAGRAGWVVPCVLTFVAAFIAVQGGTDVVGRSPLARPFGYANANAAYFVQSAVAALMLGRIAPGRWLRVFGYAAAVGFGLVPFLSGSKAGVIILVLLIPGALGLERCRGARPAIAVCAGVWMLALAGSVGLGVWYERSAARDGAVGEFVVNALSERRMVLWGEALTMVVEHPVAGVGAGEFARASDTARADADARFAHQEFLQHAAEVGTPGALLMIALFVWGFARIGIAAPVNRYAVLSAVAWAAIGTHATVDYVVQFAAVPLTAAALIGVGTAPRAT